MKLQYKQRQTKYNKIIFIKVNHKKYGVMTVD